MPWKTFLRTHLGAIAAADFFSVEVLTLTGLVRYLVLFVIDLQTRRVQIGSVVRQPYGAWMRQVARNLTDGVDGFLIGKRCLLHDRDPRIRSDTCLRVLRHFCLSRAASRVPRSAAVSRRSPSSGNRSDRAAIQIQKDPNSQDHWRSSGPRHLAYHPGAKLRAVRSRARLDSPPARLPARRLPHHEE
jgi:hypothetical protein